MTDQISFEDVILETLPFADELKAWCKLHPQFYQALKVIYSDRFVHLGAIVTSYSPNFPDDEVIGLFAYDYRIKNPKFKQDFIINKGKKYEKFILYTRNPNGSSKWVKDISVFYSCYGKGGYYVNSHHLTLEQLPEEIRPRGLQAVRIAERLKKSVVKPEQTRINEIYRQIVDEKKNPWLLVKKIQED